MKRRIAVLGALLASVAMVGLGPAASAHENHDGDGHHHHHELCVPAWVTATPGVQRVDSDALGLAVESASDGNRTGTISVYTDDRWRVGSPRITFHGDPNGFYIDGDPFRYGSLGLTVAAVLYDAVSCVLSPLL